MQKTENGLFEYADSEEEIFDLAEKTGIKVGENDFYSSCEFYSEDVTIGGEEVPLIWNTRRGGRIKTQTKWKGIGVSAGIVGEESRKLWKDVSTEITGLNCPNCHAQAFKTDHKNIAVCGACPGWYFFFRKLEQEKTDKKKMKLVMRNGDYVLVEEDESSIEKDII